MKVSVSHTTHITQTTFLKDDNIKYCPHCGYEGSIWFDVMTDFYQGNTYYCVVCGFYFDIPTYSLSGDEWRSNNPWFDSLKQTLFSKED